VESFQGLWGSGWDMVVRKRGAEMIDEIRLGHGRQAYRVRDCLVTLTSAFQAYDVTGPSAKTSPSTFATPDSNTSPTLQFFLVCLVAKHPGCCYADPLYEDSALTD